MDYLSALSADFDRLVEVSAANLDKTVPTCPDWTVDDLVRHVAIVYLHKVACMRDGVSPRQWPPDLSGEPTLRLLRRAFGELTAEFAARDARSAAYTFYDPDQSVGFWLRRMAQETVIHRIDAELAAGVPSRPVPDDLAWDGVDEVLDIFLAWASAKWADEFGETLSTADGRSVAVLPDSPYGATQRRVVVLDPAGVQVQRGDGPAAAEIKGAPDAVLRRLWRRTGDDSLEITGDPALVRRLTDLLKLATQ